MVLDGLEKSVAYLTVVAAQVASVVDWVLQQSVALVHSLAVFRLLHGGQHYQTHASSVPSSPPDDLVLGRAIVLVGAWDRWTLSTNQESVHHAFD